MLADPAAAAVAVPAVADRAALPVPALAQVVAHRVQLPLVALQLWLLARAHRAVPAVRPVVVVLVVPAVLVRVVLAGAPVRAQLVVAPAVPVQQRLSRRCSSAAMARNTT